jgi:hypothetical protein
LFGCFDTFWLCCQGVCSIVINRTHYRTFVRRIIHHFSELYVIFWKYLAFCRSELLHLNSEPKAWIISGVIQLAVLSLGFYGVNTLNRQALLTVSVSIARRRKNKDFHLIPFTNQFGILSIVITVLITGTTAWMIYTVITTQSTYQISLFFLSSRKKLKQGIFFSICSRTNGWTDSIRCYCWNWHEWYIPCDWGIICEKIKTICHYQTRINKNEENEIAVVQIITIIWTFQLVGTIPKHPGYTLDTTPAL